MKRSTTLLLTFAIAFSGCSLNNNHDGNQGAYMRGSTVRKRIAASLYQSIVSQSTIGLKSARSEPHSAATVSNREIEQEIVYKLVTVSMIDIRDTSLYKTVAVNSCLLVIDNPASTADEILSSGICDLKPVGPQ